MLSTGHRALGDPDVAESARLVQCGLHRGSADAGKRRDLVDRQVADAVMLDLARDDAKHGALAFRVVAPQRVGQGA